MHSVKMLNIGCGATHHPAWINLDVHPTDPTVLPIDINKGLPFSDGSVGVCYSSHVLEHLTKDRARNFMAECMRVLKSGGVIRLAVPDLEGVVREYIRALDAVSSGDKAREADYDWIMLEMYDQTVRNHSGGEMGQFLANLAVNQRAYIKSRIGVEAEGFWKEQAEHKQAGRCSFFHAGLKKFLKDFYMKLVEWVVTLLVGKAAHRAFQAGMFRNSGEIHQWMYDKFSLQRLLERAGFVDVRVCIATESRIPEYEKYSLDALNGVVRKPDSIFIEASKP